MNRRLRRNYANLDFVSYTIHGRDDTGVTINTEHVAPVGTQIITIDDLEYNVLYSVLAYSVEYDSCDWIFIVCIDKFFVDNTKMILILRNNNCPVYNKLRDMYDQKIPNKKFTFQKRKKLLSQDPFLILGNDSAWNILEN